MNKTVLINGVDVSKCEFYSNMIMDCNLMPLQNLACSKNPNCHFKQWQREKDKNAALNDSNKHAMRALRTYGELNKKYYNAIKLIHDKTTDKNTKEIARVAIYTGGKEDNNE
ncbi:MAG: hypothetical protein J5598_01490 [Clostridia bacterium]|jgi:hypothetical protein|nr:hypothetical protein [Clostridia bacterium]